MSVYAQTSMDSEPTDGDIDIITVPRSFCRLCKCMRRGNGVAGWIPNDNKSPSMTSSNQVTIIGTRLKVSAAHGEHATNYAR
ncbi:hypothetical protein AVEN_91640-1 [Araneus ventricosus]|uniref:Uncharacterized protein n=1 Tax=Araneus ventricosus TaxID=182803 RepID=A0A4Y2EVE8_ARAVE|nr:hypothetical protein AVEN_91640-1 [Araneus ventricosus]